MNDVEKWLAERELPEPSEAHRRRMDALFAHAALVREPPWRRPVALWQCAAACLLFCLAGYWACGMLEPGTAPVSGPPPASTVVYIIQPGADASQRLFDASEKEQGFLEGPVEVRINGVLQDMSDAPAAGSDSTRNI